MDAQARDGLRGVPGVAGRSALFKLNPRHTMRLRERLREFERLCLPGSRLVGIKRSSKETILDM